MTEEEKKEIELPQKEKAIYDLDYFLKVKAEWYYEKKPIQEEEKEKDKNNNDSNEKIEDLKKEKIEDSKKEKIEDSKKENFEEEENEEEEEKEEEIVNLEFSTLHNNTLILHWGVFKETSQNEWNHIEKEYYPEKTKEFDKNALQTEFIKENNFTNEEIENLKKLFLNDDKKLEIQIEENERKKNKKKKEKDEKRKQKELEKQKQKELELQKLKEQKKIKEKEDYLQKIKITIPLNKKNSILINGLNFVFYSPSNNKWYNNYNRDYQIKFKSKKRKNKLIKQFFQNQNIQIPDFVFDIINCESKYGSWTLMHRYNKCYDIIQSFNNNINNENWIWILIWLKFSNQKRLDWQRRYNTRPILLSNAMNKLSYELTKIYSENFKNENLYNNLFNSTSSIIKNILSKMGKGIGNGQEIRDEILKVMSRNKIVKNPLNNFYEQWHQKLHNNTTPEDIIICEGVISFLKNKGDINSYWKVLNDNGINKERLASYDRKIINEPFYNPNFNIKDFENYLLIIKRVHSTTDLILSFEQCKYCFCDKDCKFFEELINNKDSNDTIFLIQNVTQGREILQNILKNNLDDIKKLRDILFFELSLEVYVRQLVEKIIHIKIDYEKYIEEINLIMKNIKISYPNYLEFSLCFKDWFGIVDKLKKEKSKDSFLKVKSVISRINRLLSNIIDFYNKNFDLKAKFFGKECNVDKEYCDLFSEEMIRGTIFFALSILLKKIEPIIRKNAELSDWLIISRIKNNFINGKLIYIKNLHEVQFIKYEEKTIILSENVDGNEEIPFNCIGLIIIKSENFPDILSHVSVRARNLNCFFCVCFNENLCNDMLKLINNNIKFNLIDQEINFEKINIEDMKNDNFENEKNVKINIPNVGENYEKIYLELNEFNNKLVGAKSNNTLKIYKKIPNCDFIKYPESFAIPFNVNEYFLNLPENKEIKDNLNEYISKINSSLKKEEIKKLLDKCKEKTLQIKFIENSETNKLKEKILNFGINKNDFDKSFNSIKKVWSSKYNERVYLSLSKLGISIKEIKMSILCQKIIPAEFSFVIHTKNPITNNSNELFSEIVIGMGETLVGAYEGQSFSFIYYKKEKKFDIKSYPNKSFSLKNSGFIFRSDSNIEDLENFSGAGLFDSVCLIEDKIENIFYCDNLLFNNKNFVNEIMEKISLLGIGVEKLCQCEQDIEGVYFNNDFYIVQTRPQV